MADFNLLDTARKVELYGIQMHSAKVAGQSTLAVRHRLVASHTDREKHILIYIWLCRRPNRPRYGSWLSVCLFVYSSVPCKLSTRSPTERGKKTKISRNSERALRHK